jgi:ParB family chromosome partitioning protein
MTDKGAGVRGEDIAIGRLVPLHTRSANPRGYGRILASMKTVGLVEPLCVFEEGNEFIILDGYLRYQACRELGIETVPCLILPIKEAYTCNRMVNHLSAVQEHRMLRQSLSTLKEDVIAKTLGLASIKHRLKSKLLSKLHKDVIAAFDNKSIPLRLSAEELTFVKPEYQAIILKEMEREGDYSAAFVRTLILRAPDDMKTESGGRKSPWRRNPAQRKALTAKLEEVEKRFEFYAGLYRQYVTDLLKLCVYVRRLVTNRRVAAHLKERHPAILQQFEEIIFETEGKKKAAQ